MTSTPVFLPAILSGILLYTAYFPLSLGFVAWFALVPFLTLIRANVRPRRLYFAAFVGALAFYLPAIQWMRVAHPAMYGTWIGLAICCALYFPLGLWLVRIMDRARIPMILAVPAVWVGFEYFRAHFPTGFSWMEPIGIIHRIGFGWYFLGYSQHDFLSLIQIADVTGVYGVSILIALVNVTLWLWWNRARDRTLPRPIFATALTALLFVAGLGYGLMRLNHEPFADGPRVALLQGNVPQDVKMTDGDFLTRHYFNLWKQAVIDAEVAPDLTIFPETSLAGDWVENGPEIRISGRPCFYGIRDDLQRPGWKSPLRIDPKLRENPQLWKRIRQPVLFGVSCIEVVGPETGFRFNSALLLDDYDHLAGRYDKMHLVPFGEYVPLKNTFPFLSHFTPYKGDYSCTPGARFTRFPVQVNLPDQHKVQVFNFGCIICYEDSDPALARRYVEYSLEGGPVDFLVNISNDGWFDGTPEHEEHLAICRFRAIETRRAVVRAVNMGISAIIDPDGRVIKTPKETWHASKKVEAVVTGIVPIDHRSSIYAAIGDVVPLMCWLATSSFLLLAIRRSRRT
jgi:apolipoprotein N-acyltransferase